MKRAIPLFGLLLLSSLLHSAHAQTGDGDAPGGGRADAHQARQVPAFHGVELAGTMGVEVVAGKPGAVELVGDAELFGLVSTTVKDGVLVIDTRFPKDAHNIHMHAVVSVGDVSSLMVSGTGSIKASNLASPTLSLSLPGTGHLKVAGTAGALRVEVAGTGSVSAQQLVAKSVVVAMSGTGSATVDAIDAVDADLSGTGSIDIQGHPARITKRKTGLGSIHIR
ncbi:MAG TPA: DUF2807 domain-containing protein [Kofleriaceae bacterium]